MKLQKKLIPLINLGKMIEKIKKLKNHIFANISESDKTFILSGIIFINIKHENFSVCKNYSLHIEIEKNMVNSNVIPKIKVTRGMEHFYPHINKDNTLCLEVSFIQRVFLGKNDYDLVKWFDNFFLPFVLQYEYFVCFDEPLYGERSHYQQGIYEALNEYLDITDIEGVI